MWIGLCPGGVQLMLVNILQSPIFAAIVVIVNIVARNPTLRVIVSLAILQIIALIFMRYYTKCNKIQSKEEIEKEFMEKLKLSSAVLPDNFLQNNNVEYKNINRNYDDNEKVNSHFNEVENESTETSEFEFNIIQNNEEEKFDIISVESNINISENMGDNEDDIQDEIEIVSNLVIKEDDDEVVDEMVIGSHSNSSDEDFMEKIGIIPGSKIIFSSSDEEEDYTKDIESIERPKFMTEILCSSDDDEEEDYTNSSEAIERPNFMLDILSSSNNDEEDYTNENLSSSDEEDYDEEDYTKENLSSSDDDDDDDDKEEDYTKDVEAIERPKFMTEIFSSSSNNEEDYEEEDLQILLKL
jgi:hypothetical protein